MATSKSHNDDCAGTYFKRDSCRIIFKIGDLLSENDIDVIVIPTPENGQRGSHSHLLYEALLSRGDQNSTEQIKKLSQKIKPGEKPQNIRDGNRSIILTPIPYYRNDKKAFELLKKTYTACLELAVREKYQSIAFPTIGCGQSGFEPEGAAVNLYQTLTQFDLPRDKHLNEIRIVIYDKDILNHFVDVFMRSSNEKNSRIKFEKIESGHSSSSNMPLDRDRKQASQQRARDNQANEDGYPDDFDDEPTGNHRDGNRRKPSDLDPKSPEFRPKNTNQRRPDRRYRINENKTELIILQGDILRTKVDAIVNAANEHMLGGGGVDGVIHRAAGDNLRKSCKAHKEVYRDVRLPTGRSPGPRYEDFSPEQCKEHLTSCYKTSLALANLYDLETIGFTAISCGIFGYPLDEGAEVALKTVDRKADLMSQIFFVLKDDDIYDAWVKKAKELHFLSLDEDNTASTATNTSKQPNKVPEKSSADDDSATSNPLSGLKVNDQSTPGNAEKPTESTEKSALVVANEEADKAETAGKKDDGNESDQEKKTDKKKSEKQKNNIRKDNSSPSNSSTKNQAQTKEKQSQSSVGSSKANKPPTQGKSTGQEQNNKS